MNMDHDEIFPIDFKMYVLNFLIVTSYARVHRKPLNNSNTIF